MRTEDTVSARDGVAETRVCCVFFFGITVLLRSHLTCSARPLMHSESSTHTRNRLAFAPQPQEGGNPVHYRCIGRRGQLLYSGTCSTAISLRKHLLVTQLRRS